MSFSLVTWNVNGIRAAAKKGFLDFLATGRYDVVCVQETKIHDPAILEDNLAEVAGYRPYWGCHGTKKGYSGVAIFSKEEPLNVRTDFGPKSLLSVEGRVMEADYGDFLLFNVYFPNGGSGEERLNYKLEFYRELLAYIKKKIKAGREIILTGDFNTARTEDDLARPKENVGNSGFMPIERESLEEYFSVGLADVFRLFHQGTGFYSYWDMKTAARDRNVGWRIDYFLISPPLVPSVVSCDILADVYGSDHAPVLLRLK